MNDDVEVLHKCIRKLIGLFQHNPFDFLSETDLQAMLFSLLFQEFGQTSYIEMAGGFHDPAAYGSGSVNVRTIPVKVEYYPPNFGQKRFDLVIIDRDEVRHFDRSLSVKEHWNNDCFWSQPVRAAVELKYCPLGEDLRRRRRGMLSDVEKKLNPYYLNAAKDHRFLGIAMLFIQASNLNSVKVSDECEIDYDPQVGVAKFVVTPLEWHKYLDTGCSRTTAAVGS